MAHSFPPSVSLARSYALEHGLRVRLRLAQSRDLQAVQRLLRNDGGEDLDAARLLRYDPRRRIVICATALIGASETLVGIGALDIDADVPDVLCVEETLADDLSELLSEALRARASAIGHRDAA